MLSTHKELWGRERGLFICIVKKKSSSGDSDTPTHTHTRAHNETSLLKVSGSTFLSVRILPSQEAILLQNLLRM